MERKYKEGFAPVNGISMHYLDYEAEGEPILLLHSITGNAQIFYGLVSHGLAEQNRLIIPDLRGRGMTSKPNEGYTLPEQCGDLIALMDHLGISKVVLCGHSFGGLLAIYFTAHHSERVSQVILLDIAVELNPLAPLLLSNTIGRLVSNYASWESYLAMVRAAPFMNRWDDDMIPFLRIDVQPNEDGSYSPRTNWMDVNRIIGDLNCYSPCDWRRYVKSIKVPVLLIFATEPFAFGQVLIPEQKALETFTLVSYGNDAKVAGNHFTMLFGEGAGQIIHAIREFRSDNRSHLRKAAYAGAR